MGVLVKEKFMLILLRLPTCEYTMSPSMRYVSRSRMFEFHSNYFNGSRLIYCFLFNFLFERCIWVKTDVCISLFQYFSRNWNVPQFEFDLNNKYQFHQWGKIILVNSKFNANYNRYFQIWNYVENSRNIWHRISHLWLNQEHYSTN